MRHLEASGEPPDGAGDDVEPPTVTELLARGEEQLIAQADAQERPLPVQRPAQGGEQSKGVEIPHGVVKGPVAREHDGVGLVDEARILGHPRGHPEASEGATEPRLPRP